MAVREQHQHHVVLFDIGDDARRIIERFIAESEREHQLYARARKAHWQARDERALHVWRLVRLERPERRHYPFETMTKMIPTANLPAPLSSM